MRGNWAMLASDMFNCIDKQKLGINHSFERTRGYLAVLAIRVQKWHLQKSASDDEVKIELRPVLAQFKANLSFPTPGMLLSGL